MDLGRQPERSAPDSHSRKPCREAVVKVPEKMFWLEISQPSPLELYRLVLNAQLVGSRSRQRSGLLHFLPCSFLINVCCKSARSGDSIQHFPKYSTRETFLSQAYEFHRTHPV